MTGYVPVGEKGFRHFAVMALILDGREPELIYEVRAKKLDRQPGEVCFPGGMIEEGETPLQCALRETREEIGIPEERIRVICEMDQIHSTAGSQIHCFLGVIDEAVKDCIQPSQQEVDHVFTVSVNELLRMEPDMYVNKLIQEVDPAFPYDRVTEGRMYPWRSGTSPVPVYYAQDHVIWGLTGRMTRQLMEVLKCSR